MAGVTPKAKNHEQLGPTASRFVDVGGLPWEESRFPGHLDQDALFRQGDRVGHRADQDGAGRAPA